MKQGGSLKSTFRIHQQDLSFIIGTTKRLELLASTDAANRENQALLARIFQFKKLTKF